MTAQPHPSERDAFEVIDDTVEADINASAGATESTAIDRLNTRHIQSILTEKKALYRQRTYMVVVAAACIGVAGQLIWMGVAAMHARALVSVAACGIVAVGLIAFSIRFFKRAKQLGEEVARRIEPSTEADPDFSTLSDGSQFADNLNRLHRFDPD